ncbi:PREDICTED: polyadenylate-binding protein 3-like isoform X2 [Ipomoea nil]|uniref:polyadenylate-binding protein 3-like isoform X2 n=1 Tax=Ipomoea nil TaxID=35883 RepID=UPI000900F6AA|nr:PREDICTED: polyadenylate-binding protein 3-like isoform X2 [Ipomoea nil]
MEATLFGDDVMGASQGDTQMGNSKGAEEVEPLSVFVGNVDYACTVDEVHQHFEGCGTVNRVTILSDKYGQPKGFAYVEFVDEEAVQEALSLNESQLHGRKLKVMRKRKNVPGMKQRRPRNFNPYVAYGYEPSVPPYFYSPYGVYGHFPRFRKPQ